MFQIPGNIDPALQRVFQDIEAEMFRLKRAKGGSNGGAAAWANAASRVLVVSRDSTHADRYGDTTVIPGTAARLGELLDVVLNPAPRDKSVLTYNSSTNTWRDSYPSWVPVTNTTGTTVTLTTAMFNTSQVINNASDVTANLPTGAAAYVGGFFEFHRIGAGTLTIKANGTNTIGTSVAGGTLSSKTASQETAVLLRLITATRWAVLSPVGTWRTDA